MRLCISIPPITATTSCCGLLDPTFATVGGTMIGVAYFPAKNAEIMQEGWSAQVAWRPAGADRLHPRIVYSCGALMRRVRANRRFIMTLSV